MPHSYTYPQKLRKIFRIALPSGANSLLDIVILALSMFFMGRFGEKYIVALSVGMQFMMMFFAINAIFYIGTNAQISRFFGMRDSKEASKVFSTLILLCLLSAAPIILFAWIGIDMFIAWIGVGTTSANLAHSFLVITIFGIPALLLKNIIVSAFAAIGNTLSIFLVRIFTTLFCIFINYLLIFGVGLNIVGAACANVLTSYVELFVFIILIWKKKRFFAQHFYFRIVWRYFYIALKVGVPSGIERLLTLGSLVLTTKIVAGFGEFAIAGNEIGSRIEAFAFMPGFGFMVAAMALTGQNLGANRVEIAMDLNKTILQVASVIMGIFGVVMAIFARPLSMIFNSAEEVVSIASMYLLAVGCSQIPLIWVFVLDGVLRGAGITKLSLLINACSIWCFRIAPIWIGITMGLGIWWVFVMIFVETYIRALLFYLAYKNGYWKHSRRALA